MEELFQKSEQNLELILKRFWKCDRLEFVGLYKEITLKDGGTLGLMDELHINDRAIFYPGGVERRKVSLVIPLSQRLDPGQFYITKAKLAPLEFRKEKGNPYFLIWDTTHPIKLAESYLPPKEFIKDLFFKKGSNPEDASTIAAQLKLNQLELYTHTKRFIFELIQNADDMPMSNKGVNISIFLLKNYLLFKHNGKFFDRDDVKAISNAAQSNKTEDIQQTGYKGIGFKSVFTDSNTVYIDSGSYTFKFDKTAQVYQNFWELYRGYTDKLTPSALNSFRKEFEGNEAKYTNLDFIPWQIKPIWFDRGELSEELKNSPYSQKDQVNIALKIGEEVITNKKYDEMISSLFQNPRFLLFLRNTRAFEYCNLRNQTNKSHKIELSDNDGIFIISYDNKIISSYIKGEYDIEISNQKFAEAGFDIEKYEERPGLWKFQDKTGEIKNIPEKLGRLKSTRISFAAKIEHDEIVSLEMAESYLFNYLPTSDQRFRFPFLVNADFVSLTNREMILSENRWNHYLFFHIGYRIVTWCKSLAHRGLMSDKEYKFKILKNYLNILPVELLNEYNEDLQMINASFNKGILEALKEIPFIVDEHESIKYLEDIIVDETNISRVFSSSGYKLFHDLFVTEKKLPHRHINPNHFKREYLEVDYFTGGELVTVLFNDEKKSIFAKAVQSLDSERYTKVLSWFNQFCTGHSVERNWVLSIPIVRYENEVFSLNDALDKTRFLVKTKKTKIVEPILMRAGIGLSEFYIDDSALKSLYAFSLQRESYLKSEKSEQKLYDHIVISSDFSKLDPKEKNDIVTFFNSLIGIGLVTIAEKLPIFKSKKVDANLSNLSSLISSKIHGVPAWFDPYIIDSGEEYSLGDIFQAKLLKKGDILHSLLCKPDIFIAIVSNVPKDEINSFYDYVEKLHAELPPDHTPDYTQTPWVYIEGSLKFVLPAEVYWPDSLVHLTDYEYSNVKRIIEYLTDEHLPNYAALRLKDLFSLGSKPNPIKPLIKRDGTFLPNEVLYFIKWLIKNSEPDFFSELNIDKASGEETKFKIYLSGGVKQYFTADKSLIDFIEKSSAKHKYALLPALLDSEGIKSIGLLKDAELITSLINGGLGDRKLSTYVFNINDAKIKKLYIDNISIIELKTSEEYNENTDEHRIIQMILDLEKDNDGYIDSVKNKITIDGYPLLERSISEDVYLKFKKGETEYEIELKLSQILPSYKDETSSVTAIIQSFPKISYDSSKKLFGLMKKGLFSVYNELHNLDLSFFDAVQSLFLIVYKDYNSTSKQFDEKANFTSLYESDPSKYQNEAIRYLNLCFEKSVPEYIRSINFPDFNPDKKLLHTEYALSKVEELPAWVKNWKEPETDDKKVKFIIRSGVNSNDSPIWNVRSGLMHGNFDRFNLGIAALEDTELLSNTLKWLKYKEEFNHMFLTASYLTPIYLKLENKGVNVKSLLIPVIHPIEHSNYMLIHHNESIEYHYRNTSWGDFAKIIIDSLDIEDKKVVDDVLSSTYRQQLNVQNETVTKVTDIEILKANSVPLSEFYYTQWPLKNRYPIWEYNGKKIPYNVKYKDLLLSSFSEELAVCVSDNYYVVAEEVANIPYSLRYILPEDAFQDLQRIKAEIEHQDAAELENVKYSDAETEALKKLFGNDIPEEFFKDLNLQACISALVIYGNKEGYNIEAAECNLKESHQFSQIKPIYAPGSTTPLTIMCRSARNGILHLTAQAWNRLDSADTLLFVKTGRMDADYFIFNNKNEVLEISKTNYQVFRVQTTSAAISTDSILKGTFSKDKIWLILKMRDRTVYKSIFDGNIREIESDPRWDNIDTSDI